MGLKSGPCGGDRGPRAPGGGLLRTTRLWATSRARSSARGSGPQVLLEVRGHCSRQARSRSEGHRPLPQRPSGPGAGGRSGDFRTRPAGGALRPFPAGPSCSGRAVCGRSFAVSPLPRAQSGRQRSCVGHRPRPPTPDSARWHTDLSPPPAPEHLSLPQAPTAPPRPRSNAPSPAPAPRGPASFCRPSPAPPSWPLPQSGPAPPSSHPTPPNTPLPQPRLGPPLPLGPLPLLSPAHQPSLSNAPAPGSALPPPSAPPRPLAPPRSQPRPRPSVGPAPFVCGSQTGGRSQSVCPEKQPAEVGKRHTFQATGTSPPICRNKAPEEGAGFPGGPRREVSPLGRSGSRNALKLRASASLL